MERWRWELTTRGAFQTQRSLDDARIRQQSLACLPLAPPRPFAWPTLRCKVPSVGQPYGRWITHQLLSDQQRPTFVAVRAGAFTSVQTSAKSMPTDTLRVCPWREQAAQKLSDGSHELVAPYVPPAPAAGTAGFIARRLWKSHPTCRGFPLSRALSGPYGANVNRSTRPTHTWLHVWLQARTRATWTRRFLFA